MRNILFASLLIIVTLSSCSPIATFAPTVINSTPQAEEILPTSTYIFTPHPSTTIMPTNNVTKESEEGFLPETLPLRTLLVHVDESHREELFDRLREISEKHSLEFRLSFYENGNIYFLEMDEGKLAILAVSRAVPKPADSIELVISFFEKDPANPPSQETVDELYIELRNSISEVPSVEITEEN